MEEFKSLGVLLTSDGGMEQDMDQHSNEGVTLVGRGEERTSKDSSLVVRFGLGLKGQDPGHKQIKGASVLGKGWGFETQSRDRAPLHQNESAED